MLVAAVILGGTLQRVSGMGMGLVLSPVLALLLGPATGVTVTNMTTVMSALLIGFVLRAGIDWKRFGIIAPSALLGAIPGGQLVRELDGNWLSVMVGALLLLALLVTVGAGKLRGLPHLTNPAWLVPFAALGAFLNTVSGVAAPALVIYALLSRWDQRSFQATLQPVFLLFGALSVAVKVLIGATPLSVLPDPWILLVILAGVLVAIAIGGQLSKRVSPQKARAAAILVAGAGAVSALIRGLIGALG